MNSGEILERLRVLGYAPQKLDELSRWYVEWRDQQGDRLPFVRSPELLKPHRRQARSAKLPEVR